VVVVSTSPGEASMRQFGELEAVIMDRLWARQLPTLVREILDELTPERPLAYTTVLSVMDKLHRKGWLHREPDGRAYRYVPVQTRDAYSATLMREALEGSTDQQSALVHFVEQMSAAETSALQAVLDAARLDPRR
jgi:predicted transcriptional regulator